MLNNIGQQIDVNGSAFVFPQEFASGIPYDVTVATQPTNPAQACTISNGSGEIVDHDITDVAVDCVTVETESGLDDNLRRGRQGRDAGYARRTIGHARSRRERSSSRVTPRSLVTTPTGRSTSRSPATGSSRPASTRASSTAHPTSRCRPTTRSSSSASSAVARTRTSACSAYLADGTLDTASAMPARSRPTSSAASTAAYGVVIQPDGMIVVVGHAATGRGERLRRGPLRRRRRSRPDVRWR